MLYWCYESVLLGWHDQNILWIGFYWHFPYISNIVVILIVSIRSFIKNVGFQIK